MSDELLNETPLQYSTSSVVDAQNNEIAEHEVRQEEELGMENKAACVGETIVNVEGIDVATTKKGARQVNAKERLMLKRLREIFDTKVHDFPSVKNLY